MSDSDLTRRRSASRNLNIDLLQDSGFRRIGPSNLFRNQTECLVLSPGVGEGERAAHTFDIRVANLDRMVDPSRAALLLRLAPDWFAFFRLTELLPHLNESTLEHGAHSGDLYRFRCELDETAGRVTIVSTKDSSASASAALLDRDASARILTNMCK